MIINFEQSADFYFHNAIKAKNDGDYRKSFRNCFLALEKEPLPEYRLLLAVLYTEVGEYNEGLEQCFYMLSHRVGELKGEVYLILSKCYAMQNKPVESCYYLSKRAEMDDRSEAFEQIREMLDNLISDEDESPLYTTEKHRTDFRAFVLTDAAKKTALGYYNSAYDLIDKYFDEKDGVPDEAIAIQARCLVGMGRVDEAVPLWDTLLSKDKVDGYILRDIAVLSPERKDKVVELLTSYRSQDDDDIIAAIAACDAIGDYVLAARLLSELKADGVGLDFKYLQTACAVAFNSGERKRARLYLKELLDIYPYLPGETLSVYFERYRRISISNDYIPREFAKRIVKNVEKYLKNDKEFKSAFLTSSDFRKCVKTLLFVSENTFLIEDVITAVCDLGKIGIDFLKEIALCYNTSFSAKARAVAALLTKSGKSRIKLVTTDSVKVINAKKPEFQTEGADIMTEGWSLAYGFLAAVGVTSFKAFENAVTQFIKWQDVFIHYDPFCIAAVLAYLGVERKLPLAVLIDEYAVDAKQVKTILALYNE